MRISGTKNLSIKLFSLALAVFLWMYVGNQDNPLTEQTFTVPLEVRDLSPALVISDSPTFVKVRIEGKRQELSTITTREIHAFLEMASVEAGMHLVDINVSVPAKTRLISVSPTSININVETVAFAQVPVVVSYSDDRPAEGFMALPAVLSPTQVEISGPQDKLKDIKQVFVSVSLKGSSVSYRQKLPAQVADSGGNSLSGLVTISPQEIDVLVPVIPELPAKTVAIRVPVKGEPAEGFEVERVVIEPQVMTVYGEFPSLDPIDSLETDAVDIMGADKNISAKVNLQIPAGITLVDSTEVMAVVRISRIADKTFADLPVDIQGAAGLTASAAPSSVTLTVQGPESVLNTLTAATIKVYVDVAGLAAGSYQRPVQVTLPAGVSQRSLQPAAVTVTLE